MTGNPTILSIAELFNEECVYRVPIYQRAYAWGTDEIKTLLDDLKRAAGTAYHLGSLVVAGRGDDQNRTVYEVVDGQQRLTTLYLLMAVLCHGDDDRAAGALTAWNMQLEYECRAESYGVLLERLRASGEPNQAEDVVVQDGPSDQENEEMETMCRPLLDGYQIIRQYIATSEKTSEKTSENRIDLEKLRTNVRVVRDELPPGTDLNRYFEIMNTRGVQLRPQDIIKARLMSAVSSAADRETIGRIWDVCSDMDHYMQCLATPDERTRWFGEDWSSVPPIDWNQLVGAAGSGDGDGSVKSFKSFKDVLREALNEEPLQAERQTQPGVRSDDEVEQYRSIISFPAFLMHVLRIYCGGESDASGDAKQISLDDAELLRVKVARIFSKAPENSEDSGDSDDSASAEDNAKRFAATLLKCRFLFDNCIIKTRMDAAAPSDATEWTLKCCKENKKERSYYLANAFSNDCQQELIMIQSMFQVTETGNNHKNALYSMLQWLWGVEAVDGFAFLQRIREYARERLERALGLESLKDAPTEKRQSRIREAVSRGVGTEHFIFNYLDYALWVLLAPVDGSAQGEDVPVVSIFGADEPPTIASDVRTQWWEYTAQSDESMQALDCKQFRFRYRNSVEHFSPRHPLGGGAPDNVDDFGNLCLLTVQENSRRNNLDAMEKIRHFNVGQQSLKFQFMVGQAQKENAWGKPQIEKQTELWVQLLDALSMASRSR
ncbi:DUF262 domain-containing protein [Bifidobacterium animalis]|nr:DUF262 domain-containing protein [Bifidobacterium animalis]